MNLKKPTFSILFGLSIFALFLLGTTVGASDFTKTIKVTVYPHLQMFFNGEKDTTGVNGMYNNGSTDVPKTLIYEGTTYVPFRYFANKMGIPDDEIGWDGDTPAIWVGEKPEVLETTKPDEQVIKHGEIPFSTGVSGDVVKKALGEPDRIDEGIFENSFYWVYNKIPETFLNILVVDNTVKSIQTNSEGLSYKGIQSNLSESVLKTKKIDGYKTVVCQSSGNCVVKFNGEEEYIEFGRNSKIISVYNYNVSVIRKEVYSPEFNISRAKRALDFINSERVSKGLRALSWNASQAEVSQDIVNQFPKTEAGIQTGCSANLYLENYPVEKRTGVQYFSTCHSYEYTEELLLASLVKRNSPILTVDTDSGSVGYSTRSYVLSYSTD